MIVIPKRKLLDIEENKFLAAKVKEDVIDTIESGKTPASTIGNFAHRLRIPCGTDMYD